VFDVYVYSDWRRIEESKGVRHVNDDQLLAEPAREAARGERLPDRAPDRMWGGPGSGAACGICGVCIEADETELEIEFKRHPEGALFDRYQVHVRCFGAWERERRSCRTASAASAGAADPSIGHFAIGHLAASSAQPVASSAHTAASAGRPAPVARILAAGASQEPNPADPVSDAGTNGGFLSNSIGVGKIFGRERETNQKRGPD
jgi:hypothetical protein